METKLRLGILVFFCALLTPTLSQWQERADKCGLQGNGPSAAIVGGEKAEEYEWPWQAALYRGGRRICGASVIDYEWAITAAHCVDIIFEPEIFEFKVGSTRLSSNLTSPVQMVRATEVYVHPLYSDSGFDNDIALFRVGDHFSFPTDYAVNSVCLPTADMADDFEAGTTAVVTGWGALEQGGSTPDELYEVEVPIVNQTQCDEWYDGEITDNMICAGVEQGGIDSCQGDSGGPMVALRSDSTGQYYLIGIVSWGYGCAQPNYPGVYTRVTQFEDWISPIFDGDETTNPTRLNGTCAEDQFLCRGGECIPNLYRCSGSGQCYHDTDEEFCSGTLKMFDVFYYERIVADDISREEVHPTKEDCANRCLAIGCRAFDVTPQGEDGFQCDFAMAGYSTTREDNDADRTFNHFVFLIQEPEAVFQQAAGVVASPTYMPGADTSLKQYTWTINVTFAGRDTLRFKLLAVNGSADCEDFDQNFALLSVSSPTTAEMTSLCLNDAALEVEFNIKSTEVIVTLMTSDATEHGFLLDYESYYDCDETYTVGPGIVTSPNYPSDYPNSVRCSTLLQAPEGEVVYLRFNEMDIEYESLCRYDWVALYNGTTSDDPLLRYYCGTNVPWGTFQSPTNNLLVVFSSDGSVPGGGFKATYDFGIAAEATPDPDIAYIASLEGELSTYKFGMAGVCVAAALIAIVLSASLYTVNKRDAQNAAKVAKLAIVENGNAKPGYNRLDSVQDNDYTDIGRDEKKPNFDSQGTQATKTMIVAETGANAAKGIDEVDAGKVNEGFEPDYSTVNDRAEAADAVEAVAAAIDEVASGVEEVESDGCDSNTKVVVVDVIATPDSDREQTLKSKSDDMQPPTAPDAMPSPPQADETLPPPPPDATPPPPPADATPPPPPPADDGDQDKEVASGNTSL
ncbi:uncharacterized protein [Diadema antillarum]|uniref:uncharacterized protein n=1 Tax=Diadema antillarum TaxID=105358 RepID=UPI003A89DD08